ncbi:ATP-dependent 6-phosphofructokinase [Bacillus sp. SB49]|uniref:ATP-dependent 6-phosphofructokinase n=1 Tax=Bacillaceae TaxID=186817 RepID=UPI00047D00DB|nr:MULTISPECIES: ATP-dependent 6-phosphofructokinase [Bacillaceae]QHT45466.1 ATP-dependent 6-phosphofructokinase [Bacillus sp. SB49]
MNRIGVLTSGGDAPGMNAVIRAVVKSGMASGKEVVGIHNGFHGLLEESVETLDKEAVRTILSRGGTILQSSQDMDMFEEEAQEQIKRQLTKFEIDSLIVIGGLEALQMAHVLADKGVACIAVPAAINSTIPHVASAIGFDTALNTIMENIDRIRDTADSHEKTTIVEVMGRDSGTFALSAGLVGGAETIIIPERKAELDEVIEEMKDQEDHRYRIIIMAEGVGNAADFGARLKEEAGVEARVTILDDTQYGGTPSARDRMMATRLGAYAVELLNSGQTGFYVSLKEEELITYELSEIDKETPVRNESMYSLAKKLSI